MLVLRPAENIERMDEKCEELLEIAKNVPIEFTATDDSIAAWFIGQQRIQAKQRDKKFEQDTVLATGILGASWVRVGMLKHNESQLTHSYILLA